MSHPSPFPPLLRLLLKFKQMLAGKQMDSAQSGEEPARQIQGAPFWPQGDCKLDQKVSLSLSL